MYDALASEALTSSELWACFAALRALDDALDELGAAADELRCLEAEATWQSKGVRKLQTALTLHGLSVLAHVERVRDVRTRAQGAVVV